MTRVSTSLFQTLFGQLFHKVLRELPATSEETRLGVSWRAVTIRERSSLDSASWLGRIRAHRADQALAMMYSPSDIVWLPVSSICKLRRPDTCTPMKKDEVRTSPVWHLWDGTRPFGMGSMPHFVGPSQSRIGIPLSQSLGSQRFRFAGAKEGREIHRKHAASVVECPARASGVRARAAPSKREVACLYVKFLLHWRSRRSPQTR